MCCQVSLYRELPTRKNPITKRANKRFLCYSTTISRLWLIFQALFFCLPSSNCWISCGNADFNFHPIYVELMQFCQAWCFTCFKYWTISSNPVSCNHRLFPHFLIVCNPAPSFGACSTWRCRHFVYEIDKRIFWSNLPPNQSPSVNVCVS